MLYPPPIKIQNHSIGHKSETTQPKKRKKMLHQVTYFYTFVQIFGSKFKIMSATEIWDFLKSVKLTLNGPANGPVLTYSKMMTFLHLNIYASPPAHLKSAKKSIKIGSDICM